MGGVVISDMVTSDLLHWSGFVIQLQIVLDFVGVPLDWP